MNYTHVLFEWQQIDNTSQYQIQLAKEDSFTEIIVDVLDSTLIYIDKNNINWASEYYWRVRSIDELGSPRNWIDTLQFQTDERRYDVNVDITSSEINKLASICRISSPTLSGRLYGLWEKAFMLNSFLLL